MKDGTKINLILGSHAHVPSGSPENEFEDAYENKLRPFVCGLYRYPAIQAVLHYSGTLLHWVERNHPEFFMLIEDMVSRKQAEILGGGFYEPMLPLIPLQDRIGQIELMTTYLRRHFGKRPLGCWLPACAWEQHLAGALEASGMSYTFLSQKQFAEAGLSGGDLSRPCLSEDQGKIITIFPVTRSLKAALDAADTAGAESVIAVFPESPDANRGKAADLHWNRFFENLSLPEFPAETALPGKLIKNSGGLKKASFSNSSGLDDTDYSPRRFLIEHPEANGIYAKMIFANVLTGQLRGDKYRKQSAREELWKAQDSGLYRPSPEGGRHELRKAAYSSLLSAELLCREKGKFVPSLVQYDFDLDGVGEYLFQEVKINCYIQLTGAGVFELDYLPKTWNYLDCGCVDNAHRRTAFADILLPAAAAPEELAKGFPPSSRLCFSEQYELAEKSKATARFRLAAAGPDTHLPFACVAIEKRYSLKKDTLSALYAVKNQGKEREEFCFVPEINLSFAGEGEEFARFFAGSGGVYAPVADNAPGNIEGLKIQDIRNEVQIQFASAKPFRCGLAPARNNGFYQSTRIMPFFALSLESGETWSNELTLKFLN